MKGKFCPYKEVHFCQEDGSNPCTSCQIYSDRRNEMLYTTFALATEARACGISYRKFAKAVGGISRYGRKTPIPLIKVLDVCGLGDTLWALRCCTDMEKAKRLSQIFACDCAEHVLHIYEKCYPNDNRVRNCIEITRKYIDNKATSAELAAARAAARAAAWAAAWAAARAAARAAAWDAAWDAAGAAAGAAAWDAAWDAEKEWQADRLKELLKES